MHDTNLLAQTPYDGCFVDMLGDAMLSNSYLTSQPIDPATGQVWTPAQMLAATTGIAQTVTANNPNAIIMANGLLDGASYFNTAAPTSQLFAGADPALAESWLRQATKSVSTYESPASWQQEVDMLADAGGRGDSAAVTTKVWTTATAAQVTAWHRYALASFLLGTTGSSYFSFTTGQTATEFQTMRQTHSTTRRSAPRWVRTRCRGRRSPASSRMPRSSSTRPNLPPPSRSRPPVPPWTGCW